MSTRIAEVDWTTPPTNGQTVAFDATSLAFKAADNVPDGSVTTIKIVDANVTLAKMATDSVGTAQLLNIAVTTAKINDLAVTTDKINTYAVTTAELAAGAVTAAKMATDSIATANIIDANVTAAKLVAAGAGTSFTPAFIAGGATTGLAGRYWTLGPWIIAYINGSWTNTSGGALGTLKFDFPVVPYQPGSNRFYPSWSPSPGLQVVSYVTCFVSATPGTWYLEFTRTTTVANGASFPVDVYFIYPTR